MLNQIQQRSEILKIDEVDLVLDHAIYAKKLEILVHPENIALQKAINMRMGDFMQPVYL